MRKSKRINQKLKSLVDGASIWIRSGLGPFEEPGTLLKMNVHLSDDENQDANGKNGELRTRNKQKKSNHKNEKGALVRYNALNYEGIVHKDRIKIMFDDDIDEKDLNVIKDTNQSTENDLKKEAGLIIKRRSRRHLSSSTKSTSPEKTSTNTKTKSAIVTPNLTLSSVASSEERSSSNSNPKRDSPTEENTRQKKRKITRNIAKTVDEIKKESKTENKTRKRKGTTQSKEVKSKLIASSKNNKTKSTKSTKSTKATKSTKSTKSTKATKASTSKNSVSRKRKRPKANEAEEVERTSVIEPDNQNNETNMQNRNDNDQNSDNEIVDVIGGAPDGNGGLDQPSFYKIGYSPSGRATCRRCDEKIVKNELRVSYRPLFRGKVCPIKLCSYESNGKLLTFFLFYLLIDILAFHVAGFSHISPSSMHCFQPRYYRFYTS